VAEYERIIAGAPDVETENDAHVVLAWLYAACPNPSFRDAAAALRHVGEVKVTEKTPAWEVDRTRAAALAAAGRYGEAIRLAEAALPQVPIEDRPTLRGQLDTYRAGLPYDGRGSGGGRRSEPRRTNRRPRSPRAVARSSPKAREVVSLIQRGRPRSGAYCERGRPPV
jgi:hypothetical protein